MPGFIFFGGELRKDLAMQPQLSCCTQAGCPALASRAVGYWCVPPHVAGVVVKCFLTIRDDCGSVRLCDPPRGCLLGI